MNDFLQFLNTADTDTLIKIPGISKALAESIVTARPIESVDECLKVRGMGKNLLARAQESFENVKPDKVRDEKALIPVGHNDVMDATSIGKIESIKEETPQVENGTSFRARLRQAVLWFFRALLRLILIVLVIGGIGAAIYYGAPLINEKFVAPVEQNAIHMNELETEIASLQSQLAQINDQLTRLNNQLNETNTRIDSNQQSLDAHTATLATLEEMQATLETQLETGNNKTLLALKHEVMMTRILDMLARARLYLAQSNFGLAKEDVQSAHDVLAELQDETEDEVLLQANERLGIALANLPDFPVVASGDLEIAWQILMTGEAVATSTPESTPSITSTPEATLEATPVVTATP